VCPRFSSHAVPHVLATHLHPCAAFPSAGLLLVRLHTHHAHRCTHTHHAHRCTHTQTLASKHTLTNVSHLTDSSSFVIPSDRTNLFENADTLPLNNTHVHTHTHTCTHVHTLAHTHTHLRAHTHTHTHTAVLAILLTQRSCETSRHDDQSGRSSSRPSFSVVPAVSSPPGAPCRGPARPRRLNRRGRNHDDGLSSSPPSKTCRYSALAFFLRRGLGERRTSDSWLSAMSSVCTVCCFGLASAR